MVHRRLLSRTDKTSATSPVVHPSPAHELAYELVGNQQTWQGCTAVAADACDTHRSWSRFQSDIWSWSAGVRRCQCALKDVKMLASSKNSARRPVGRSSAHGCSAKDACAANLIKIPAQLRTAQSKILGRVDLVFFMILLGLSGLDTVAGQSAAIAILKPQNGPPTGGFMLTITGVDFARHDLTFGMRLGHIRMMLAMAQPANPQSGPALLP